MRQRSQTLFALALAVVLAACSSATPDAPTKLAGGDRMVPQACGVLGPATVVRYQMQRDTRPELQVQLLNGSPEQAALYGCPVGAPLASNVTLRYRITGT